MDNDALTIIVHIYMITSYLWRRNDIHVPRKISLTLKSYIIMHDYNGDAFKTTTKIKFHSRNTSVPTESTVGHEKWLAAVKANRIA